MIDKWNPDFDAMSHAHAVGIAQERIRQIISQFEVRHVVYGIELRGRPQSIREYLVFYRRLCRTTEQLIDPAGHEKHSR